MSRIEIPFSAPDISSVARSQRNQLIRTDRSPGHVEILNMLARTIGYRNFQAFLAQSRGAVADVPRQVAEPIAEPFSRYRPRRGKESL